MAYKKENKKMSTAKLSSVKNPKITNDEIAGTRSIPPVKKGRPENVKKETFSTTAPAKNSRVQKKKKK
jgi:hypothetical protein